MWYYKVSDIGIKMAECLMTGGGAHTFGIDVI